MSAQIEKKIMPYGLWPSPVSPALVSQELRLEDVQWEPGGDSLVWLEGRSGKGVLVRKISGQASKDLTVEISVRGRVGYGGGEFTLAPGKVFFTSQEGKLYSQPLNYGQPHPITPSYGYAASPQVSPDGKWVLYVFSDGNLDVIALVDSNASNWPMQLVRGADFYMQPAWHPDGERIAWVEWDHPDMPWDGTRLKLGHLSGSPPSLVEQSWVAGGKDLPVSQPLFSPDGRWLSYIDSSQEWDRLILRNLETNREQVLWDGEGVLLAQPAWVQGMRSYGWGRDSCHLYVIQNVAGYSSLWLVNLPDGARKKVDIYPYTWITQLSVSPAEDRLAFLASAAHIPDRVVLWDRHGLKVAAHTSAENIYPGMFSQPQPISWSAQDGTKVHGIYYPPFHKDFTGEGLPPAIVNIHGGPTSQACADYSSEVAYFTSRGYAWLEVNYRGSTGYGRSYQHAMRQRWGDVDVEDAAGGAHALVEAGLANSRQLVIHGGSAGGYTVLNTLIRYPGLFKAGVSRYGVSNLYNLEMDTHKFEAHYNASLVGELPEAAAKFYDWSPVFHAERIKDPVAIFQGADDKVVPPNQAEQIVEKLRQHGIPHIYRLYEGEGHGFRKQETIADYLIQMERFIKEHVLFAP